MEWSDLLRNCALYDYQGTRDGVERTNQDSYYCQHSPLCEPPPVGAPVGTGGVCPSSDASFTTWASSTAGTSGNKIWHHMHICILYLYLNFLNAFNIAVQCKLYVYNIHCISYGYKYNVSINDNDRGTAAGGTSNNIAYISFCSSLWIQAYIIIPLFVF